MSGTFQYILTEEFADQSVIWLNRPEKGNAFNLEMIRELTRKIKSIENKPEVRFVLLKAKGKHFCLGADLEWMSRAVTLTEKENMNETIELASLIEAIYRSSKIFIAFVHGACYGGGIGLAAACDFVWTITDVRFAFGEVKLGLVPAIIAPVVFQRMGTVKSLHYMLNGEPFIAEVALKLGLIDNLTTPEKSEDDLNNHLESLRNGSRIAQQQIKKLIRTIVPDLYSPEIKVFTAILLANSRISEEGVEGIRAFLEKRIPSWRKYDP